jgi:hypothetical protein
VGAAVVEVDVVVVEAAISAESIVDVVVESSVLPVITFLAITSPI